MACVKLNVNHINWSDTIRYDRRVFAWLFN